jgi:hypothetical protein
MNDLSRRSFLTRGSAGFALAGALAIVPGLSAILKRPAPSALIAPQAGIQPLVAHVRDLASGEISLLVGADEIIHKDIELATRLYAAARQR